MLAALAQLVVNQTAKKFFVSGAMQFACCKLGDWVLRKNRYAGRTGGRVSRRTNLFGRIGSRSRPGGMVARHRVPGADRERGRFGLDTVGAYVVVGARAGVE